MSKLFEYGRVAVLDNQIKKLFKKYFPKEMEKQEHLLKLEKLRKRIQK